MPDCLIELDDESIRAAGEILKWAGPFGFVLIAWIAACKWGLPWGKGKR